MEGMGFYLNPTKKIFLEGIIHLKIIILIFNFKSEKF